MPAPPRGHSPWRWGRLWCFTGLLTDVSVSILGAILSLSGAVWMVPASAAARAARGTSSRSSSSRNGSSEARSHACAGRKRSAAGVVAAQGLSRDGWCEGRPGWWRCHGDLRGYLWRNRLPPQCVVSDKSACRKFVRSVGNSHNRADEPFQPRMLLFAMAMHVTMCLLVDYFTVRCYRCFRAAPSCGRTHRAPAMDGLACTTSLDT